MDGMEGMEHLDRETRDVLRRMRKLALAFHGSEQRLLTGAERGATVAQLPRRDVQRPKIAAQA
jgi:hypothetical protein